MWIKAISWSLTKGADGRYAYKVIIYIHLVYFKKKYDKYLLPLKF